MTVVLCGALGATRAIWEAQLAELHAAVVVEHPGHGGEPLEDEVSVESLARRLLARVDGSFALVGLSLGGAVAIRAAALAPGRVERLLLAGTAVRFGEPAQWRERAETVRREGLAAIVDATMGRWFTPAYGDVSRSRAMFLSVDAEGYARCCEALAEWDATGDLARVRAPTLAVTGAADPTAPPAAAAALADALSDGYSAVIEGAAHLANVERPDEFNRLLLAHVS